MSVNEDPRAGMLIELSSGERAPRGEPNSHLSFAPHSTMTGFILTSAQPTRAAGVRTKGLRGIMATRKMIKGLWYNQSYLGKGVTTQITNFGNLYYH